MKSGIQFMSGCKIVCFNGKLEKPYDWYNFFEIGGWMQVVEKWMNIIHKIKK